MKNKLGIILTKSIRTFFFLILIPHINVIENIFLDSILQQINFDFSFASALFWFWKIKLGFDFIQGNLN
jgi:hypothetical protein